MDKIGHFLRKVLVKFDYLAAVVLLGICILVVVNILLRRLLGSPIFGVYEYVCYFTLLVVSLALANCALQDGHTNVTFLLEKLGLQTRKIIEIIAGVVIIVSLLLIVWNLVQYAQEMLLLGYVSSVLRISQHYIIIIIVAGFSLLALATLIKLVEVIKKPS